MDNNEAPANVAKPVFTQAAVKNLEGLLPKYTATSSVRDVMFPRYEYVDRCIQREVLRSAEAAKAKVTRQAGNAKVISPFEVPEVFAQMDTAHARLVGLFLSGTPVFGCTSENPALDDAALMLQALSRRDQGRFNFVSNLSLCLSDSLKYLVCAAEVTYADISTPMMKVNTKTPGGVDITAVTGRGNKIRRLDPYNLFYDTTVPLHEVHSRGAFAGYVERSNYINAKLFVHGLNQTFALTSNFSAALSATTEGIYKRPDCAPLLETSPDKVDVWGSFWGSKAINAASGHDGVFEISTFYVKLIPQEHEITRIRSSGTPQVFKLQWLNGVLVYAEPLTYAHGMLPIVIGTGLSDGLDLLGKSPAEQITDFQEILSALVNGTLSSLRRAVGDRALYDPQRIRSTDIDSANPTAKIPVRLNQFNKDLSSAYYAIPYEDRVGQSFVNNFGLMQQLATRVLGLNPASQGTFVKGNRTQTEYSDIQNNSDSRSLKYAWNLESSFFFPIKHIMKMNYLQFASEEELVSQEMQQSVKIQPEVIRNSGVSFNVTDGLSPAGKVISEDLLMTAIGMMGQMPIMDMQFSRASMMVHILKSKGLDLSKYKATQQEQQFALASLGVANGQGTTTGGTPTQ